MQVIILATGNPGKVAEFRVLVSHLPVEMRTAKEVGYHQDIEETGNTFVENAIIKAEALAEYTGLWAIADDSGIVVPSLNNEPGVYSARYAGEHATDAENNQKLLQQLANSEEWERRAYFVSEIALARPGLPTETFRGECEGFILREARGTGGFGYDPLFLVPEFQLTYAQLPMEIKNRISHRGKAMDLCAKRMEELLHVTNSAESIK